MLSNYLKITVRNLLRHKGYSLINVLGLAIGMACCIVILLYIQDELSYDRFHEKADQMYRLVDEQRAAGRVIQTAGTPAPWGPALQKDYPEVLNYVRMRGTLAAWLISYQEKHFYEKRLFWVDKTLFDVFTFPLIKGNPSTALKEPYSMVISEEMARKYFGDDDPMGKVLNADNAWDFKVTGVMRNLPSNSHFQADMFASFSSLIAINGPQFVSDWSDHNNFYTYLLLRKDSPSAELEKKLPGFIHKYLGAQLQQGGMELRPSLQRVTEIHLHSRLNEELAPNSDIAYVYIFAAIALFIVLIACINFMNLATARSATRAKEVGLRKVVGASRPQLIKQFLGESIFTAAIALVLAVVLVVVTHPVLTALSGKVLQLDLIAGWVWLSLIGLVVFVGVVAGSYSAVFLSAFQPVDVLKGTQKVGAARFVLRRLLVVGQFAMSIILIVAAGIVYDQLNYIKNKRLGFQKEHVVIMPLPNYLARQGYPPYKSKLVQDGRIMAVTTSTALPGSRLIPLEPVRPEGMPETEQMVISTLAVDYAFLETMGLELVAGRSFSQEFPTDEPSAFILNETAVQRFGWPSAEAAVGKQFQWLAFEGKKGRVIGVVRDFHLKSLHHPIEPVVIHLSRYCRYILVRIRSEDIPGTLAFLKQQWLDVRPNFPFEYTFLDEEFDQLHRADQRVGQLVGSFALLAIVIACLGLFGLASFSTQQRTKEIGIRKVLGASVTSIVMLLSKEFTKLVVVAILIAWPVAYVVMNRWLQDFAYRITISRETFLLAGGLALVIAWLTVSVQAIKAALANPVEALRYE